MVGVVRNGGYVSALTPGQRTPKLRERTHRSQTIEGTLKQALQLAPVMGITRVDAKVENTSKKILDVRNENDKSLPKHQI